MPPKLQAISGQNFADIFRFDCQHSDSVGLVFYEFRTDRLYSVKIRNFNSDRTVARRQNYNFQLKILN